MKIYSVCGFLTDVARCSSNAHRLLINRSRCDLMVATGGRSVGGRDRDQGPKSVFDTSMLQYLVCPISKSPLRLVVCLYGHWAKKHQVVTNIQTFISHIIIDDQVLNLNVAELWMSTWNFIFVYSFKVLYLFLIQLYFFLYYSKVFQPLTRI